MPNLYQLNDCNAYYNICYFVVLLLNLINWFDRILNIIIYRLTLYSLTIFDKIMKFLYNNSIFWSCKALVSKRSFMVLNITYNIRNCVVLKLFMLGCFCSIYNNNRYIFFHYLANYHYVFHPIPCLRHTNSSCLTLYT